MKDVKKIMESVLKNDMSNAEKAVAEYIAESFKEMLNEMPVRKGDVRGSYFTSVKGMVNPKTVKEISSLQAWRILAGRVMGNLEKEAEQKGKTEREVSNKFRETMTPATRNLFKSNYLSERQLAWLVHELFKFQEIDELEIKDTVYKNTVGPNKVDAHAFTDLFMEKIKSGKWENLVRAEKRALKAIMKKYAGQISWILWKIDPHTKKSTVPKTDSDLDTEEMVANNDSTPRQVKRDSREVTLTPTPDESSWIATKMVFNKDTKEYDEKTIARFKSEESARKALRSKGLRPKLSLHDTEGNPFNKGWEDSETSHLNRMKRQGVEVKEPRHYREG